MEPTLIPLSECTIHLGIDTAFVLTLEEYGLIETVVVEQTVFIEVVQLCRLEKFARLFTDLEINIEGIEAISHLLERVEAMQTELSILQTRLRLYE